MSTESSSHHDVVPSSALTGRPASHFLRASVPLAWVMAPLAALWAAFGRMLFGAGGLLVPWFAVTLFPVLLAVLLLAARSASRDARRWASRGTTPALAAVQVLTWFLALVFGLLVPDRVDGRSVSAASQVLGEQVLGLSAGFGNTAGILMLVGAFACLVLAVGAERGSRNRAAGRPATEDEILDAQGFEGEETWQPPNYWQ